MARVQRYLSHAMLRDMICTQVRTKSSFPKRSKCDCSLARFGDMVYLISQRNSAI